MKKIFLAMAIIALVFVSIYLLLNRTEKIQLPQTPETEPSPAPEEESIVQQWAKTENPTIKDANKVSYTVWHVEWNTGNKKYDLWDKTGKHFQITKNNLINSIIAGIPPFAILSPVQIPIPVPLPAPILPITPPTPTPQPLPTPAPSPPTPSPPKPQPTPSQNTTPIPTPTPQPIPPAPQYPLHCSNNQWNGDESDLDCGGSCAKCPLPQNPTYLSCWTANDCLSGNCDMSQAKPLPAIEPNTGAIYTAIQQLQSLAGQTWIISYQGRCK